MDASVALVVGGTRRIGREVALCFARRGYNVAISGLANRSAGQETFAMIRETGRHGAALFGDAGEPEAASAIVAGAVEAFGRLDSVVYCAALRVHDRLSDLEVDRWNTAIGSVLTGSYLIAKHAAPQLAATQGSLTFVGGASAFVGGGGPATPAAKAGLIGLVRSLALELGPQGVRVNIVSPGRIEAESDTPEHRQRMERGRPAATIPLRRPGTPAEVARVVVALASEDFSYVTGQVIHVNGGFYMG